MYFLQYNEYYWIMAYPLPLKQWSYDILKHFLLEIIKNDLQLTMRMLNTLINHILHYFENTFLKNKIHA